MSGTGTPFRAPIFIVGHPRSGTSLLAAMLGRHPQVLALPETHFFNEVRYALAPHYARGAAAVAGRLETTRMRHLPLERERVREALARAGMTPKAVFEALAGALLEQAGRERLVERSPVHIRHVEDILAMWPDAQVIWIVRDGRAAISSLRKLDWASDDLPVLARQWTRNMRFALAAHAAHPEQVMRVDYEDLIAHPTDVLARLCARTGLSFDPAMLDHKRATQSVSSFEQGWKANVDAPLIASRASAWQDELSADERAEIEAIMAPVLIELGYLAHRPVSLRALREALRERLANNAVGRWAQKSAYALIAARRFAPDGSSQANARRR